MDEKSNTHALRVKILCYEIAFEHGDGWSTPHFPLLRQAYFHDIGKSHIPEQILKQARQTHTGRICVPLKHIQSAVTQF